MRSIDSINICPQYLHAKLMKIVMEMVTAMPEHANALLIMSMPKIARIMDVSTMYIKQTFVFPFIYILAS